MMDDMNATTPAEPEQEPEPEPEPCDGLCGNVGNQTAYGGYCGDDNATCVCYYSWGGPTCSEPVTPVRSAVFLTLQWFWGVALLSLVAAFALVSIARVIATLPGPVFQRASWAQRTLPFITMIVCFCAAFIRIFYFALVMLLFVFACSCSDWMMCGFKKPKTGSIYIQHTIKLLCFLRHR